MPWDPSQYLSFGAERLRPAIDLLARIPLDAPAEVLDLGCGAGNVSSLLAARWPAARIRGIDNSREMLGRARAEWPGLEWIEADLRDWAPAAPVDLVFSNAALHWLEDHATLFPQLAAWVRPGGALAVQMPASHREPHHQAAFALAEEPPWRDLLGDRVRFPPVHGLAAYQGWLAPSFRQLDLWETTYLHRLEGEDPVTGWFKGSLLVPFLEALPAARQAGFLAAYGERVRKAYPKDPEGRTLMPMRRVFLVGCS